MPNTDRSSSHYSALRRAQSFQVSLRWAPACDSVQPFTVRSLSTTSFSQAEQLGTPRVLDRGTERRGERGAGSGRPSSTPHGPPPGGAGRHLRRSRNGGRRPRTPPATRPTRRCGGCSGGLSHHNPDGTSSAVSGREIGWRPAATNASSTMVRRSSRRCWRLSPAEPGRGGSVIPRGRASDRPRLPRTATGRVLGAPAAALHLPPCR